jgi:hypothetical protein
MPCDRNVDLTRRVGDVAPVHKGPAPADPGPGTRHLQLVLNGFYSHHAITNGGMLNAFWPLGMAAQADSSSAFFGALNRPP